MSVIEAPALFADKWANGVDIEAWPFGVRAGDNNGGWKRCPFCHKPHDTILNDGNADGYPAGAWFLFKDRLSAREYTISGLCQECQDKTFTEPEEEELNDQ